MTASSDNKPSPKWRFTLREIFFLVAACAAVSLLVTKLLEPPKDPAHSGFVDSRDIGAEWMRSMTAVGISGDPGNSGYSGSESAPRRAIQDGEYQFLVPGAAYDSSILEHFHDFILAELDQRQCSVVKDTLNPADNPDGFTLVFETTSDTRGFMRIDVIPEQGERFTVVCRMHEFPDL